MYRRNFHGSYAPRPEVPNNCWDQGTCTSHDKWTLAAATMVNTAKIRHHFLCEPWLRVSTSLRSCLREGWTLYVLPAHHQRARIASGSLCIENHRGQQLDLGPLDFGLSLVFYGPKSRWTLVHLLQRHGIVSRRFNDRANARLREIDSVRRLFRRYLDRVGDQVEALTRLNNYSNTTFWGSRLNRWRQLTFSEGLSIDFYPNSRLWGGDKNQVGAGTVGWRTGCGSGCYVTLTYPEWCGWQLPF